MNKGMMLLVKFICLFIASCTKPSMMPTPNNPNIEYLELDTTYHNFYFDYDFDRNGVLEMKVSVHYRNGSDGYQEATGLILIPNGFVQNFDAMFTPIVCGSDTVRYAKKMNYGDSIYYDSVHWIANKQHSGALGLFYKQKITQANVDAECGYFNAGELYVPIRFYGQFDYGEGWYNAWMLVNATDKDFTIKSVAWYKSPNTSIKAGEK